MTEKATFLKLEKDQWIEVDFDDIKKNDVLVKLDTKDCYWICTEQNHYDEYVQDNVIVVDSAAKPEIGFNWNE